MDLLLMSPRATLNHAHRRAKSRGQLPEATLIIPVSLTDGLSNVWGQKGARRASDFLSFGARVPHSCFDPFHNQRPLKFRHRSDDLEH